VKFDRVAVVDWSAAATPSPARPSADAIWIGVATPQGSVGETYHRTRSEALEALRALCRAALDAGERLLIGTDFPHGYPAGFAQALTGQARALAVWDWLAAHVQDAPDNANNRFELAAGINARFPGVGPFWGRPESAGHARPADEGQRARGPWPAGTTPGRAAGAPRAAVLEALHHRLGRVAGAAGHRRDGEAAGRVRAADRRLAVRGSRRADTAGRGLSLSTGRTCRPRRRDQGSGASAATGTRAGRCRPGPHAGARRTGRGSGGRRLDPWRGA
jgi:hypothetical protein